MIDVILRFVTLGSVIIGAIAIYTALRNNSRQMGAQIFLAYSDRLHTIRSSLPEDAYSNRLTAGLDAGLSLEARRDVLELIQLVFELHALKRHGYVDRHIWLVWEPDIDRLLDTDTVRREWPVLSREFATHPKFTTWVAQKQKDLRSLLR